MSSSDELDERLRQIIARWDYDRSPKEIVALGQPALKRLLDAVEGKQPLWRPEIDPRDYVEGQAAAVAAFGHHDLDGVLTEMNKRGWSDELIALSGVGSVPDRRLVPALVNLYSSKFLTDRLTAMVSLGRQRDPRATETLVGALSDRSAEVRSGAIRSLGETDDPTAIEPLRSFAKRTREAWLARDARSAIAKIRQSVRSSDKKKG